MIAIAFFCARSEVVVDLFSSLAVLVARCCRGFQILLLTTTRARFVSLFRCIPLFLQLPRIVECFVCSFFLLNDLKSSASVSTTG